ncbi:MAG: hypothetical protein H6807_13160 [Planctomycetes bacterium]|nr:hypothetical protein [Planctomycetota bacterium]
MTRPALVVGLLGLFVAFLLSAPRTAALGTSLALPTLALLERRRSRRGPVAAQPPGEAAELLATLARGDLGLLLVDHEGLVRWRTAGARRQLEALGLGSEPLGRPIADLLSEADGDGERHIERGADLLAVQGKVLRDETGAVAGRLIEIRVVTGKAERARRDALAKRVREDLDHRGELALAMLESAGRGDLAADCGLDGDDLAGRLVTGLRQLLRGWRGRFDELSGAADELAAAAARIGGASERLIERGEDLQAPTAAIDDLRRVGEAQLRGARELGVDAEEIRRLAGRIETSLLQLDDRRR